MCRDATQARATGFLRHPAHPGNRPGSGPTARTWRAPARHRTPGAAGLRPARGVRGERTPPICQPGSPRAKQTTARSRSANDQRRMASVERGCQMPLRGSPGPNTAGSRPARCKWITDPGSRLAWPASPRSVSWRQWVLIWQAATGSHTITVRATDSEGVTQTQAPPPRDGATGWHTITVNVD
jgi:hypothetical protein